MATYFCKQAYVDNLQQICRKEFQESSNNFDLLAIVLFALKLFKEGMGKLKRNQILFLHHVHNERVFSHSIVYNVHICSNSAME